MPYTVPLAHESPEYGRANLNDRLANRKRLMRKAQPGFRTLVRADVTCSVSEPSDSGEFAPAVSVRPVVTSVTGSNARQLLDHKHAASQPSPHRELPARAPGAYHSPCRQTSGT